MNEIYVNILEICTKKHLSNEIFGVAMTLFHYYSFYKSFKEFDRSEISVACVFLACKIEYSFLKVEDSNDEYFRLKRIKNNQKGVDYVKFEIEILSFLDFEIDIVTPFLDYYQILFQKFPLLYQHQTIRNFSLKLIYDSYRKPLCIYYNSKYLVMAVIFISLNIYEPNTVTIHDLILIDNQLDSATLISCVDNLFTILDSKIKLPEI